MTKRLDRLRAGAPDMYAQADGALQAQGAANSAIAAAKEACLLPAATVNTAARALLSAVCEDATVPMIERAGWTTASIRHHNLFGSIDDFAAKADECKQKLEAIDEALREPGAPILAINPGPPGDFQRDPRAMRYAVKRSNGSGLDIHQAHNAGDNGYHHWVNAPQEGGGQGRSVNRGFFNGGMSDLLISNIITDRLLTACVDPEKAVSIVYNEDSFRFGLVYIIGETAMSAFFADGSLNAKMDMLRGAVAFAGVTL